jgi:hypothetical protein
VLPLLVVAAALAAVVPVVGAGAAGGLSAEFRQQALWRTWYAATYTVVNGGGDDVRGWVVEFDLPAGTSVATHWEARLTRSGDHYRFASLAHNGAIRPGGRVSFGFVTSGTGLPAGCRLNGAGCAAGDTTPTPTPPTPPPTTPPIPPFPTIPITDPPRPGRMVLVATAAELTAALADARAGDWIRLLPGTYAGRFRLVGRSGTVQQPITVEGPRDAVLDGGDPATGYGFELRDAAYARLVGFTVTRSQKAVVTERTTFSRLDGLHLHHIGDEAVALRRFSTDNVVTNSLIEETGLHEPRYGEGVYIGTWNGNWGSGTGGQPDASDRNVVLNNTFGPNVRAEHVDIKEGTSDGLVRGNRFVGGLSGENFADSWIDAQGNGYVIEENVGTYVAGAGVFAHGFETHMQLDGWGCGNVFRGNRLDLGGVGQYGIRVHLPNCAGDPNVVHASNTVTGATAGLTNIPVTP